MYTDDVQLYIHSEPKNTAASLEKLEMDLDNIAQWSHRNALVLNPTNIKVYGVGFQKTH